MIAMMLAALVLNPVADAVPDAIVPRGRCRYSQTILSRAEGTVLVTCDKLDIDRATAGATFDFSQKSWGSMLKFHGDMSGERMTVKRVTLRNGTSAKATGTCEIFRSGGRLSKISCLADAKGQTYVANFVPTRF